MLQKCGIYITVRPTNQTWTYLNNLSLQLLTTAYPHLVLCWTLPWSTPPWSPVSDHVPLQPAPGPRWRCPRSPGSPLPGLSCWRLPGRRSRRPDSPACPPPSPMTSSSCVELCVRDGARITCGIYRPTSIYWWRRTHKKWRDQEGGKSSVNNNTPDAEAVCGMDMYVLRRKDDSHMTRALLDMYVNSVIPKGRPKLTPPEEISRRVGWRTSTFLTTMTGEWKTVSRTTHWYGRAFKVARWEYMAVTISQCFPLGHIDLQTV